MAERVSIYETDTNEMQIMEFTINGETFGINVAKVKEIMVACAVKPMPHSHEAVEGVFQSREHILTVIDLPYYLTKKKEEKSIRDLFLITSFNRLKIAFRVHTVKEITRISWNDVLKPEKTMVSQDDGVITGIAKYDNHLVTLLDFEKIVADLSPDLTIKISDIEKLGPRKNNNVPILIAEDSILLTKMIQECLNKAGYLNLKKFTNGKELYDYVESLPPSTIDEQVSLVITDIEMPIMDGYHLIKLLKASEKYKHIPIVIFSSLINEEMETRGRELGVTEQIAKPEIKYLVEVIDHLLEEKL